LPETASAQATFVVNSIGDASDSSIGSGGCNTGATIPGGDPECTLRAAVQEANDDALKDTINFNIPGAGVHTILPATEIPILSQPVIIDGSTQPGYTTTPLIELDGTNVAADVVGLAVLGGDSTVRGLAINSFNESGLLLQTGGQNLVAGNHFGTDASGTIDKGNGLHGVAIIDSSHNVIGGVNPGDQNVLSGNDDSGVAILNAPSTDNLVIGNLIGTDVTGLVALGNSEDGVAISATFESDTYASDNIIGGPGPGEANVISGNGFWGVEIFFSDRNQVLGNIIGLNKLGLAPLPNEIDGVLIFAGADNRIGGGVADAGNVISGNSRDGIAVVGGLSTGTIIEANYIGTNIAGNAAIGNGRDGIVLSSVTSGLPSSGTVVGSTEPGFGNVISGNGNDGIQISFASSANSIIGNYIGISADGLSALGNVRVGVGIFGSHDNAIGGIADGAENVISGNAEGGLVITADSEDVGSINNTVQGNIIGLGPDGSTILKNGQSGIIIQNSADNTIGGSDINSGNTISGNDRYGITIEGDALGEEIGDPRGEAGNNNIIRGNIIGTDVLATTPKPNGDAGIIISEADGTKIGGALPEEANIISGNRGEGILVFLIEDTDILGNYIGTNPFDEELGNYETDANVIAFNGSILDEGGHGIIISGGFFNAIRKNSIFENAGRGISLRNDRFPASMPYAFNLPDAGEDLNGSLLLADAEDLNDNDVLDFPDADSGPNGLQNFPLVTHVQFGASTKTVEWTLYSQPDEFFTVDLFANDEADPSGLGEGKTFLKSVIVQTDLHGHGKFSETFNLESIDGQMIGPLVSATATDQNGNTSEFSIIDTDGDSVADQWELRGIDIDEDGVRDYPLLNEAVPISDPFRKDVFVEADVMASTFRFADSVPAIFEPTPTEQNDLVSAFATVPWQFVNNPLGKVGIALHLDIDETIPHHQWLGDADGDGDFDNDGWPFFFKIKNSGSLSPMGGFGSSLERSNRKTIAAKRLIYRYAIFADTIGETDEDTMLQVPSTTLGIGQVTKGGGLLPPGFRSFVDGGNDFFIAMGTMDTPGGTPAEKTGTFMHELGHTLGLMHGGVDHLHRKPNYHSVMNYLWVNFHPTWASSWVLDFSRRAFDPLDETAIDESAGFDGHVGHQVPVGPAGFNGNRRKWGDFKLQNESGQVDLDGNMDFTDILPLDLNYWGYKDLNGDGVRNALDVRLETLTSRADWSSLRFNFLGTPVTANATYIQGEPIDEPTREISQDLDAVGDTAGEIAFSVSLEEVDENAGIVTVSVRRIAGTVGAVSVDFETFDDSAIAGQDYTSTSGTLNFLDGEIYQTIDVEILDDGAPEPNEVFEIHLSNPTGGATLGSDLFYLGIRANDGPGDIEFLNPFFDESEDAGTATITVVRNGGTVGAVSVDYESADSLALDGEDYTATSGTLNFADGVAIQTFTVPISQDTLVEGNEGLLLSLSNPTGGAGLGPIDLAALTILNVAELVAEIDFSLPSYRVNEVDGMRTVEVVRSKVLDTAVSVDVVTSDGTATAGADYTHTSVTLNFAVDEVSKTFDIPILDDALAEGAEKVILSLENLSAGALRGTIFKSEVRILDDESITVTNTNDVGPGSLRQAIIDANSDANHSFIDFDVSGCGVCTINIQGHLDPILQPLTIDGYTQFGAKPNSLDEGTNAVLKIVLDGQDTHEGGDTRSLIDIRASNVLVRGLVLNRLLGPAIRTTQTSDVIIEGNFIGTDASGTIARLRPNTIQETGIYLALPSNTLVGGTTPESRNLISGLVQGTAIRIESTIGTPIGGNSILGNLIGVGADGGALGNNFGLQLFKTSGNIIGGPGPLEGNVIANSALTAIFIDPTADNNSIRGNSIFGSGLRGVNLNGNRAALYDWVDFNDPGDLDEAANGIRNHPVLGNVQSTGGVTTFSGYLSSQVNTNYILDFYSNSVVSLQGYGEGETYLGHGVVNTGADGIGNFNIDLPVDLPDGIFITAMATDPDGSTSEFSLHQAVGAVLTETFVVNTTDDGDDGSCTPGHCSLREAIRGSNNYFGHNTINFNIPGPGPYTIIPEMSSLAITETVLIDGYSQPGTSANTLDIASNAVPLIELDGMNLTFDNFNDHCCRSGLIIAGTDTIVRGLVINRLHPIYLLAAQHLPSAILFPPRFGYTAAGIR